MTKAGFRILITDRAWPDLDVERAILAEIGGKVVEPESSDEASLEEMARGVDAIAACWAEVTPAVIRAARRCRIVARLGIGLDNIAVETATELGIPVTYVPDYCVQEVSEHTLALLLSFVRRVALFDRRAKSGEYNRNTTTPLVRLSGRKLGLVGFGRIGRAVFHKAQGWGVEVAAHSSSGDDYGTGCRMLGLDELLRQSDFVSLHLPLTERTRRLIGERELACMKPTGFLINTSRGALIDHAALWQALQENRIAGAALDVFDPEPPDLSQPLFRDERVIVTPHAAFLSEESLLELRTRTARQVADALQGLRPEHVVNPQVYEKPR